MNQFQFRCIRIRKTDTKKAPAGAERSSGGEARGEPVRKGFRRRGGAVLFPEGAEGLRHRFAAADEGHRGDAFRRGERRGEPGKGRKIR